MDAHRYDYNRWKEGKSTSTFTSFQLFDKYGIENCNIVLLESFSSDSKESLFAKEAFYIRSMKCVNKYIPLRTQEQYRKDNKEHSIQYRQDNKEHYKQYVQDNKEHINQYQEQYRKDNKEHLIQYRQDNKEHFKQYVQDNKEHINQYQRQYSQDNKERINQYTEQYRKDNREKIKEKSNKRILCDCGKLVNYSGTTNHYKTKQHKKFMLCKEVETI
jgi:hypothetical protein